MSHTRPPRFVHLSSGNFFGLPIEWIGMSVRATRPSRRRDAGFNLVELMVTVIIIGVAATLASTSLSGDKRKEAGEGFARSVMREMQRTRSQAISESLRYRVHFYADRVEVRAWVRGASTGPDTSAPSLRTVVAPNGAVVANVLSLGTTSIPTGPELSGTPPAIDFRSDGSTSMVGCSTDPCSTSVWIINTALNSASDRWRFRIDVNALTGFSRVFSGRAANSATSS